MAPVPSHSYWRFLLLSIVGAFVTALTFVVVTSLSVPPGDLASQQSVIDTLRDPFVLTVAVPAAILAGLAVSPFTYLLLRHRRVTVAFPIVLASTVATVVVATPSLGLLAIPAAVAAVVGSSVLCAWIPFTETTAG